MGDSQFEHSSAEMQKVVRVRFGVLSPDEVKAMSVCEVLSPITYLNGVPADNGLLDLRMGTMERALKCKTCSMDMRECPGHFGHIELARPCLHIGFLSTIVKVLRCVCFHCSTLLVSAEHKNYGYAMRMKNPKKRLQALLKICQGMKKCNGGFDLDEEAVVGEDALIKGDSTDLDPKRSSSGCGNVLPQYRVEDGFKVMITFPEDSDVIEGEQDRKKALSAGRIHEILKRVSDADCRALGFDPTYARPDWFVITVLAVPPPCVRPSVAFKGGARSSDDLTYKLSDIVKINLQLKRNEQQGAAEPILQDYTDLLQYHICTLMDNEMSGQPQSLQRSGKPIKSIRQRLVGKAGRVRGNLMGKRVDFSARSVITPDPNLGIDQLGVPRTIAMNMTMPEIVTPYNIDKMRRLVRNGPAVHPGAKTIIRDDGKLVDLRFIRKSSDLHLEVGYKVERHLDNNDPIVFNRQPSLHKMSMMGHRVKVMPWSTFRLNLSCTSPYNADFDGDEMNMHVAQCMPELDTRVLTDTGFLFLDEIEARLARKEQVLYACYQKSRLQPTSDDDMLRGELVYRPGQLVFPPAPAELIVFNSSPSEAKRWVEGSGPYGRSCEGVGADESDEEVVDGQRCISRHVSLRVTPQHQMYVQLGNRTQPYSSVAWRKASVAGKQMSAAPEKVRASSLFSECGCPPAQPGEPDCIHRRAYVRMLSCADGGRQPSIAERGEVQVDVQRRLGFTDEQLPAFLELFGFWLGDGSLSHSPRAVQLSHLEPQGVAWVDRTLAAVGLQQERHFYRYAHRLPRSGLEDAVNVLWLIIDQRWVDFFDHHFGVQHRRSDHYDSAAAVAEQGTVGVASAVTPPAPTTITRGATGTLPSPYVARVSERHHSSINQMEEAEGCSSDTSSEGDDDLDDAVAEMHLSDSSDDEPLALDQPGRSVKRLPGWVLRCLTPQQLRLVRDGLWRADGQRMEGSMGQQMVVHTSGESFRDQLMQLLLLCGCSPHSELRYPAGSIRGYHSSDANDARVYSEKEVEALSAEERAAGIGLSGRRRHHWAGQLGQSRRAQWGRVPVGHRCGDRRPSVKPVVLHSETLDGRVWCVTVDHPEHLIMRTDGQSDMSAVASPNSRVPSSSVSRT